MQHPPLLDYGHGIYRIDTGYNRPGYAACHLLADGGEGALIDTGTGLSVPRVLEALDRLKLRPEQIRYVVPTHVHLDHAGGAGGLMAHFPAAQLIVHPGGARHLIDPSKLLAGAMAVYGEQGFLDSFGEVLPIAPERVTDAPDGFSFQVGGRELVCLDAPGHAYHHFCVYDAATQGLFTGDTWGLSYRELDTAKGPFLILPSTPVQFDPDAWHETLNRQLEYPLEALFLTHFGRIGEPRRVADRLHALIDRSTELTRAVGPNQVPALQQALMQMYKQDLHQHGCTLNDAALDDFLGLDLDLCAQGLDVWLRRELKVG